MLPLDCQQEFDPAREEEFFTALPARPAVFLVEPWHKGAQPYLLRTADLKRRLERLLRAPDALGLRAESCSLPAHARAIPATLPRPDAAAPSGASESESGQRLSSLLCHSPHRCQSCQGTDRWRRPLLWAVCDARRDPSFPGCMYSEMKMCLAPCFAGCSKEEYDAEVGRVVSFLASSGAALTGELERKREAASAALDFERAAALHRKLEKAAEVLCKLPDLARKVDELDAVILQRAAEENTIAIFAVRGGLIAEPFFLRFGELASQPRSVEEILRQHLAADSPVERPSREKEQPQYPSGEDREALAEHLALLARWFYSKPRQGEIFFAQGPSRFSHPAPAVSRNADDEAGMQTPHQAKDFGERDWPYRRIIRACSRLLAPPEEQKTENRK